LEKEIEAEGGKIGLEKSDE